MVLEFDRTAFSGYNGNTLHNRQNHDETPQKADKEYQQRIDEKSHLRTCHPLFCDGDDLPENRNYRAAICMEHG